LPIPEPICLWAMISGAVTARFQETVKLPFDTLGALANSELMDMPRNGPDTFPLGRLPVIDLDQRIVLTPLERGRRPPSGRFGRRASN
jgi:hypothetical protein